MAHFADFGSPPICKGPRSGQTMWGECSSQHAQSVAPETLHALSEIAREAFTKAITLALGHDVGSRALECLALLRHSTSRNRCLLVSSALEMLGHSSAQSGDTSCCSINSFRAEPILVDRSDALNDGATESDFPARAQSLKQEAAPPCTRSVHVVFAKASSSPTLNLDAAGPSLSSHLYWRANRWRSPFEDLLNSWRDAQMKIPLISLGLLAFTGSASAQSSLTLFGVVDMGVSGYQNKSENALGVAVKTSRTVLSSNGYNSSRLGFRGTEDLGGGLAASFWLEAALFQTMGLWGRMSPILGRVSLATFPAVPR